MHFSSVNLIFFVCIAMLNLICSVQCCSYFRNVEMEVVPRTGNRFNTTVNSCIGRTAFNTTIVKAYVVKQHIPSLTIGAVQNMAQLRTVSFDECSIETIEPGAFRNVPRLSDIALTNSKIKKISVGVFNGLPALGALRIHNNKINEIEEEALANIPTLYKVYASYNKLKHYNPKWFTNSTAVIGVDFRHNLIQKISANAFQNLKNLSKIYFEFNEISEIEPGAFQGLEHLAYLGLRYNRLTIIEPNIFPNHLSIELLSIDANKLNFLHTEILNKVSIKSIRMDGNPWKCPCIDSLLFWVHEKNITVENTPNCSFNDIPVCVFPQIYSSTCIEIVDDEVTTTYLEKVTKATVDNKDFKSKKCVRFD